MKLTKPQLIEKVKVINPLGSKTHWNKYSKKELENLYNKGIELGVLK